MTEEFTQKEAEKTVESIERCFYHRERMKVSQTPSAMSVRDGIEELRSTPVAATYPIYVKLFNKAYIHIDPSRPPGMVSPLKLAGSNTRHMDLRYSCKPVPNSIPFDVAPSGVRITWGLFRIRRSHQFDKT